MDKRQSKRAEAIERIQDAQEMLREVIDTLESVARELDDRHADAYIIDHLKILASSGHGFLDSSYNLDKWIEDLGKDDEEEEDCDD